MGNCLKKKTNKWTPHEFWKLNDDKEVVVVLGCLCQKRYDDIKKGIYAKRKGKA